MGVSLPYQLTITPKPGYLHAIVSGANTKENVERCLRDVQGECAARACPRVLIEDRLVGPRLDLLEVFHLAEQISERAPGVFEAVAYVDVNAENDRNMRFAEDVAVNRVLPGRTFLSVEDAEGWLRSVAG